MKNKHYFLRMAILKTMSTGLLYLIMPVFATYYEKYVGGQCIGYTMFGAGIMIVGNIILLIRAWGLALDKDVRKSYLSED